MGTVQPTTKITIHFGLPKSGTSAIQMWLVGNQDALQKESIYYPEHGKDPNNISSGNVRSIFDRDKKGSLQLNHKKLVKILRLCEARNCSELLLSSEIFFKELPQLAEALPDARFIGYIRFPLAHRESMYNQAIKRHDEVDKFTVSDNYGASMLSRLSGLVERYGAQRFVLRPYSPACYQGGGLISDFLSLFGVEHLYRKTEEIMVNSSYALECLEFKRWFNQFELGAIQSSMDFFLQSVECGTRSYSLLPPEKYEALKPHFIQQLSEFCSANEVHQSEVFLEECRGLKQKPYHRQILSDGDFEELLEKFISTVPINETKLISVLNDPRNADKPIDEPHRRDMALTILRKHSEKKKGIRRFLSFVAKIREAI